MSRPAAPDPQRQNLAIQALRAVAALLVVVGHAIHETEVIGPAIGRQAIDASAIYWGFGVDIFFVISGFIMVYSSADLFGRPGAAQVFLWRRTTRIVPLYWVLTTALLAGALVAPALLNVPIGDWRHIVSSYLFIPSLRAPGEIRPVMALGWTLNMEMFFYVLFAAVLFLPLKRGLLALSAVIGGFALVGVVFEPEQVQLAFWTQSIVLEFLFGCWLGWFALRGARLTATQALLLAALGFAGMVRIGAFAEPWPMEAIRWGLPALAIVAAAALAPQPALPSRALLWPAALGNASYSLYLVHPFVLRPLRNLWIRLVGDAAPVALYVVAAAIASTLVSLAVYRWMERPLLRWAQGRRKAATARPADAAQPLALRTTT